jgi:hypothetical protein
MFSAFIESRVESESDTRGEWNEYNIFVSQIVCDKKKKETVKPSFEVSVQTNGFEEKISWTLNDGKP